MQDADGSPCDEGDFGRLHGLANEKLCGKVVMCDVMRLAACSIGACSLALGLAALQPAACPASCQLP
jgi:hypothetical protein